MRPQSTGPTANGQEEISFEHNGLNLHCNIPHPLTLSTAVFLTKCISIWDCSLHFLQARAISPEFIEQV